jgi:hypothetical protein
MLKALLGDGHDLVPLKRVTIEKTEGNPFFMEEIVQGLFEQGALLRNGSIKLAKSLSTIQIPSTVQAVLASRIDRLPQEQKDLLQTLAVIGKEFQFRLVVRDSERSSAPLPGVAARVDCAPQRESGVNVNAERHTATRCGDDPWSVIRCCTPCYCVAALVIPLTTFPVSS